MSQNIDIPTVTTPRTCGECTVCCDCVAVERLHKPAWVPCKHLSKQGCGIYDTRPEECKAWFCEWVLGWGKPEDRPDKSGLVIGKCIPAEGQIITNPIRPFAVWQLGSRRDPDLMRRLMKERKVVIWTRPGVLL